MTTGGITLLLIAVLPTILGTIDIPPRDTPILADSSNVRLDCLPAPNVRFQWRVVAKWLRDTLLVYDSNTGPAINPNFTFSENGTSLFINKLTHDLSTIYVCQTDVENSEARVVSMGPIQCHKPEQTVTAGEFLDFNCSVFSYSYAKDPSLPLTPTLAFLIQNGTAILTETAKTSGNFFISGNYTATPEMDEANLTCRVNFLPGSLMNTKSNFKPGLPATYEDTCTYKVFVNHLTTKAQIDTNLNDSSNNVAQVGHPITCFANGRPKPSIEWLDGNNTVLATGANLTLTNSTSEPVKFVCRATNYLDGNTGFAETAVHLQVTDPNFGQTTGASLAPWQIALMVVIPLIVILIVVVIIIVFCCLRKKKTDNQYKSKPKKNGKYDPSAANLIYTPTPKAPTNGPSVAAASYPPTQSKSPPPRPDYSNSPFGGRDGYYGDDLNKNPNVKANVGHGDLGMAGLSGSRGADLNMGSRGNVHEPSRQPDRSFSPKPTHPYGGSSEALNMPPYPRQPDPTSYYDNMDGSAPKQNQKRQNQVRSPPPPPPTSYLDQGYGRQPSVTSTSTNRSASSEGSRVGGRVEMNPAGKQKSSGGRRTSPQTQGYADEIRKQNKKASNPTYPKYADGSYPSPVHSLQGSEV